MNKKLLIIALAFIAGHSNVYSADNPRDNAEYMKLFSALNAARTRFNQSNSELLGLNTIGELDTYWQPKKFALGAGALGGLGALGLSKALGNEATSLKGVGPAFITVVLVGSLVHQYCKEKLASLDYIITNERNEGFNSIAYNKFVRELDEPGRRILCKQDNGNRLRILNDSEWEQYKENLSEEGEEDLDQPEVLSEFHCGLFQKQVGELDELINTRSWCDWLVIGGKNMKIVKDSQKASENLRAALEGAPERSSFYRVKIDQATKKFVAYEASE